jgi:ribosomal protein S18 acetylase RimI-like enzyme
MLERSSADDTLQMDGICVSASARGKGVGSALFDALFAYARKRDYSYITLDVIDTNPRAKALYERLGFEATKTEGTSVLKPILGFSYATKMRRAL